MRIYHCVCFCCGTEFDKKLDKFIRANRKMGNHDWCVACAINGCDRYYHSSKKFRADCVRRKRRCQADANGYPKSHKNEAQKSYTCSSTTSLEPPIDRSETTSLAPIRVISSNSSGVAPLCRIHRRGKSQSIHPQPEPSCSCCGRPVDKIPSEMISRRVTGMKRWCDGCSMGGCKHYYRKHPGFFKPDCPRRVAEPSMEAV